MEKSTKSPTKIFQENTEMMINSMIEDILKDPSSDCDNADFNDPKEKEFKWLKKNKNYNKLEDSIKADVCGSKDYRNFNKNIIKLELKSKRERKFYINSRDYIKDLKEEGMANSNNKQRVFLIFLSFIKIFIKSIS